jgi:hypothetical protein
MSSNEGEKHCQAQKQAIAIFYLIESNRVPHQADVHAHDREICTQGELGKIKEGKMGWLDVAHESEPNSHQCGHYKV